MMNETKIRLSPTELELITNAEIILTKNAVIKKMVLLLEDLQERQRVILSANKKIPPEVLKSGRKISKGENYLGLPYLVLDQPRHFEINHIFAIRTMFWWGRFFSITLQLSGKYKDSFQSLLHRHYDELRDHGYFFCIHEDQWKHHLEADNYVSLKDKSPEEITKLNAPRSFLKLAKKIELDQLEIIDDVLEKEYRLLVGWLA